RARGLWSENPATFVSMVLIVIQGCRLIGGSRRCRVLATLAHRGRVPAHVAVMTPIRLDDGFAVTVPIDRGKLRQLVDDGKRAQVRLRISLSEQWLRLEEWLLVVDLDRTIRRREPKVDKERAKPPVRLDDAFVTLVRLAARQVHRRTQQEAPARRRLYEKPRPDLNHAGEETSRQKGRCIALDVVWREVVEVFGEIREMLHRQRIPRVRVV